MQSRFLVPVIVATAFHALVFLGFNRPGVIAPPEPTPPDPVLPPMPRMEYEVELDPVTTPMPSTEEKQRKGSPDAYRPVQDEPPPTPSPIEWEIPREPVYPIPPGITDKLSNEIFGDPNGDEQVEWKENVVIDFKHLDNPPRTRSQIAPVYPHEAKSSGLTGEVLVDFVVDENGRVIHARVVKSSSSVFDVPTLRAVEKWRFEPGKKTGRAVRFRMIAPVVFNLDA